MKYELVAGENWDFVDGEIGGRSQGGSVNHNKGEMIVWNIHFGATFRTISLAGYPKLVMGFTGPDDYGKEIIQGYAVCVLPIRPGKHDVSCHIFKPVKSKYLGLVYESQASDNTKEVDFRAIASGKLREISTVEHMGTLTVSVNISHKNVSRFGYQL